MIAHIFKLVWNKKWSNVLMISEIFISFLILFAVVMFSVFYISNYNLPLGYDFKNRLVIEIDNKSASNDYWSAEQIETTRQLENSLREMTQIEIAGMARNVPYSLDGYSSATTLNNKRIRFDFSECSDQFGDVMGVHLIEGRWFDATDDASDVRPVVINSKLREELFGDQPAINQVVGEKEFKIVGVVDYYRKDGEFTSNNAFMFKRVSLSDTTQRPTDSFIIKLKTGTPVSYEEQIQKKLESVARNWSFRINSMENMRDSNMKFSLIPIYVIGTISVFLLLMVGLGLLGVLWQNVTQRRSEIGLRRALGAHENLIHFQISAEILVIAFFGVVLGTLVVIQIPILDMIPFIEFPVFITSLLLSWLILFVIVFLSSWYPSKIATTIQPVEALHWE